MKFVDLGLAEPLLRAVCDEGYSIATQIQVAAIPPILEGRDVFGCAQTGTGKTAAFALPTLDRLRQTGCQGNGRGRKIRCLVLSPTRELSQQISQSFEAYGRHTPVRTTVIYGGVGQSPQVRALNRGVDVVVATPGRLMDLMQQGFVDLSQVEVLILDEADRMLDMGFLPDMRRIISKVPSKRQTLLFSATMPDEIRDLADEWLRKPVDIRIAPATSTVETIEQAVCFVAKADKLRYLTHWLEKNAWSRVLVFTRTKYLADKVAKTLGKSGLEADSFHSDKSQTARQRVIERFKAPRPMVLVATDIAARGLDIDDVSYVINYDLPMDAEGYVHRIGRTGRAGAAGKAISFCSREEQQLFQTIERRIKRRLAVIALPEGFQAEAQASHHANHHPKTQSPHAGKAYTPRKPVSAPGRMHRGGYPLKRGRQAPARHG